MAGLASVQGLAGLVRIQPVIERPDNIPLSEKSQRFPGSDVPSNLIFRVIFFDFPQLRK